MTLVGVSCCFDRIEKASTPELDCVMTWSFFTLISIIISLILLLFLSDIVYFLEHSSSRISTYSWEQFNNIITTTRSKYQPPRTTSSWPYHSLDWLNTVLEIIKVTRNSQFTNVGLSNSMPQTRRIHYMIFWCLPLIFVVLYEFVWKNWMF